MKFDVIIGNPPYQAARGYKTAAAYKDVDGKHGCKRLYYFFTKLAIEQVADDGVCMFVQPPGWRASKDGRALRLWIRDRHVVYGTLGTNIGAAFKGVTTDADIQTFRKGDRPDKRWHGRAAVFTEHDWQRAWIDAAEAGAHNLLLTRRGGYKEDLSLPLVTVYETYKRGIIRAQRRVAPRSAGQAIILPEFRAPYKKNFQKAEIVEDAPVSACFIAINGSTDSLQSVMSWIRSKPFFDAMDSFHGSSHLGTDHFITEAAFNTYVKEIYDRETRSLSSPCQRAR